MHDDDGSGSIDDRQLSPMQAGMLFQALLDPRGGFDIEQLVVRLREPIDDGALREGWRAAARTHEALRSSFRFSGLEHPVQHTQATFEPEVVQHDWESVNEAESEARLAALLESDRQRGFDLERPAWRVHVCRLGPQRVDMVWSIHHMLVDGASFATVLSEVLEVHGAVLAGRAPPQRRRIRPSADAARVPPGGATSDLERNFWRAQLEGKLAPTPLPFAEPASNPLPDRGTGEVTVSLDERTTADLHALAIACDQPMAAVVHALWAMFLSRWSGDSDVLFGSTPTTRPVDADADAHDMVGMFINSLPMRVALAEERTVRELLGELSRQGRSLREHASSSLVEVASATSLPRGVPLFETVVDFDSEDLNETLARHDPTWRARQVSVLEQPAATLVLTVFDGQRLKLRLLHQRRRVRDTVAARIVRHLERLAHQLARGPDQKLGAIDSLPDDERQRILVEWNDTERPFPSELGIHQGFEAQVDRQPMAVAVVQDARTMSYRELEEASNRLAHLLRQHGAAPGTWVGVCMERTPELVTALLGIAKSGAAYVPLDPDHPAERIAFMVEDSGVELVVTERALRARLDDVTCLELDGADRDALAAMPSTRPAPVGSPADPCYAIYTSGSSGRPKGVVLAHRAVVNTFDWVSRTFQVRPGDRLLFVTSPSFDLSVYDTFGVLAAGATLEVASAALLRDPGALVARLVDGEITLWDSAPQALQQLTPFLPERAEHSRLRLVMLSGDWIPLALPPALQRVFPQVEVHSLGGATEAAIWSNWFPVGAIDPRWTSVPYGRPLQNVRYHVLDAHMRPAPIGVPGDLYIGGACLAEGYRNRPELTVERFVPDPFREQERDGRPARLYQTGDRARYLDDGNLEFLGRADLQVKVRGFRVELGEIEFVLGQEREVSEAVCVARRDPSGETLFGRT